MFEVEVAAKVEAKYRSEVEVGVAPTATVEEWTRCMVDMGPGARQQKVYFDQTLVRRVVGVFGSCFFLSQTTLFLGLLFSE